MRNSIEMIASGIKCDHCDYRNDSVKFEEYDEWLNKPCPECGENLLTQADLNNTKILVNMARMLNNFLPKTEDDSKKVRGRVEMDGSGKVDIKIEE